MGLQPRGFSLDVVTAVSFLNIVTFLGVGHCILKSIQKVEFDRPGERSPE